MTVAHATPAQVADAIKVLAACDHYDQSRRAARNLPDTLTTADLQRAADGCALIARFLAAHRRSAA